MITLGTKYAQLAKRLPGPLYKVAAQAWIDKGFPRHLFVETTASCNLSCEYCPREKVNKHMDWELFRAIIDEASHYGPRSFSLHLFGEPLLYPRFREAIDYIKAKNKRHTVLLTTNGTLLERYADTLTQSHVDQVLWSWRSEVKWSEDFKERLKKWKAFTVRIIEEVTPQKEKEEFLKWPRVERRSLHNYGGNINLGIWQESIQKLMPQEKRWPCYHLWLAPAVAWNGNLLLCCADPHQKEVRGNLKTMTISSMWSGLQKIREAHLRGEFTGICEKCDVWKNYPDLFFSWQRIGASSSGSS